MTKEEKLLEIVAKTIKGTEWENRVYLVGGAVRDDIMGAPVDDLDFVVDGNISAGIDFATWLGHKFNVFQQDTNPVVYPRYGTAKLLYKGIDLEFVAPRIEKYNAGSRKPEVSDGRLVDDALRRDLTINSLMVDISTGKMLDLTGNGINDIKNGVLRTPVDPEIIFKDDPIRMLRIVRFSAKYGFPIPDDLFQNIKKHAPLMDSSTAVSPELIQKELNKILVSDRPSEGIEILKDTGLLKYVFDEFNEAIGMEQNVHHSEDVFQHTMSVLKNTPPNLKARLTALFHDIGKVLTKTVSPDGAVHFYGHEEASERMVKTIMGRLK